MPRDLWRSQIDVERVANLSTPERLGVVTIVDDGETLSEAQVGCPRVHAS